MNFSDRVEESAIHVELKYCERCGGLWLRLQGVGGVYCASCRSHLDARPNPGQAMPHKARPRRKALTRRSDHRDGDFECVARIDYLEGVAATGVWA